MFTYIILAFCSKRRDNFLSKNCLFSLISHLASLKTLIYLYLFISTAGNLDEHMHLLLPALIRLFKPDASDAPLDIRRATIRALIQLIPVVQVCKCSSGNRLFDVNDSI